MKLRLSTNDLLGSISQLVHKICTNEKSRVMLESQTWNEIFSTSLSELAADMHEANRPRIFCRPPLFQPGSICCWSTALSRS